MYVIGVTGGIAAGKSLVSSILSEFRAIVVDLDVLGHQIYEPGEAAYREIIAAFGADILNDDATINRKKLGELVFNDEEKLNLLNSITHPRIFERASQVIKEQQAKNENSVVVLDGAMLLEMGMKELVNEIWVVNANKEDQIARIRERNGLSREEAEKRISAQIPVEKKILEADKVIYNTGGVGETRQQVSKLWQEIDL